jgi:Leucine-rich repeat (LRR) protein
LECSVLFEWFGGEKMSTNNNRLGKEIQPIWLESDDSKTSSAFSKISGAKLQRLMSNSIEDLTALSLKGREITKIEDFHGLNKVQRLDLSENKLKRLGGLSDLKSVGLLNVSNNQLDSGASCEELRYLTELRTLNLGSNPKIRHIDSHVLKPLVKLQALIANDCGLSKVSFLRSCQLLNTLVLSHNSLTRFPTSFSSEFSFLHLKKLSLGFNALTALPDLSVCPNISELRLNNNQLSSLTSAILLPSKLKILDLSNNLLTSWTEIEILTGLAHLTNLSLRGLPACCTISSNSLYFPP